MVRNLQIKTLHGVIETPAFLPDATYGAINSISFADAKNSGVQEIVTTTLHLEVKLGAEFVQKYGGLHEFFNWQRPILTDSGGFQVFSLIHRKPSLKNSISNEGALFKDPASGREILLTPELSLEIQHKLGSDIRVVLDEPLAVNAKQEDNLRSVRRTTEWAKRSKQTFLDLLQMSSAEFANTNGNTRPLLGGVIQGAGDFKLRQQSIDELTEIGFDTYNFGGYPLKADGTFDLELSEFLAERIPRDKIRYAMGVGTPDDIVALANMGWDLFDCVLPTRNARHGYLYVPLGEGDQDYKHFSVLHLKNSRYQFDTNPISSLAEENPELKNISRAYLRHLIRNGEASGFRLATISNLYFYSNLISRLRRHEI